MYRFGPASVVPAAVLVYMLGERVFTMIGGGTSGGDIWPSMTDAPNAKQVAHSRRQRITHPKQSALFQVASGDDSGRSTSKQKLVEAHYLRELLSGGGMHVRGTDCEIHTGLVWSWCSSDDAVYNIKNIGIALIRHFRS